MSQLIQLTQGKFTTVSDHRFEHLSRWKWNAHFNGANWYAVRGQKSGYLFQKKIYMHREIMSAPDGMEVDHIDGDGLNNQDENLRVCTHAQNLSNLRKGKNNTSGYKGVSWNKRKNKYIAQIFVKNKTIYLGEFADPIEAALVYDNAARKHHGPFANTNFQVQS